MIKCDDRVSWWAEIEKRYKISHLSVNTSLERQTTTVILEYGNSTMLVGRYSAEKGYGYVFDRRSEIRGT